MCPGAGQVSHAVGERLQSVYADRAGQNGPTQLQGQLDSVARVSDTGERNRASDVVQREDPGFIIHLNVGHFLADRSSGQVYQYASVGVDTQCQGTASAAEFDLAGPA